MPRTPSCTDRLAVEMYEPVHDPLTGRCYRNPCAAERDGVRDWVYGCSPAPERVYVNAGYGMQPYAYGVDWFASPGPRRRRHRRAASGGGGRSLPGSRPLRLKDSLGPTGHPGAPGPGRLSKFGSAPRGSLRHDAAMVMKTALPTASTSLRPGRMVHHTSSPTASTTVRPTRMSAHTAPVRMMGGGGGGASRVGRGSTSRGMHGLGEVSDGWMYGAFGLVALLGVQFWWWNKKAPQVLRLGRR